MYCIEHISERLPSQPSGDFVKQLENWGVRDENSWDAGSDHLAYFLPRLFNFFCGIASCVFHYRMLADAVLEWAVSRRLLFADLSSVKLFELFLRQNPGMDLKDEMAMFAKHEKR